MSGQFTAKRCPKCGSNLLSDGKHLWCSFVGGGGVPPCDYGLAKSVLLEGWECAQAMAEQILAELLGAVGKFGPFHSAHEGYAVILEEVDELWEQVKRRDRDPEAMRKEAIQVGAMALRFLVDVCGEAS